MSLTIFASVPVLYFPAVTLLRRRAGTRQAAEDFAWPVPSGLLWAPEARAWDAGDTSPSWRI